MGDGEVCGTAVETAMDITVRLTVRRDMTIPAPQYHVAAGDLAATEAGAYHVCTGVAPDLMEAQRARRRAMIDHIGYRYDLDRQEAYAHLLGRLRPAHPRARGRAQLGGGRVPARDDFDGRN